MHSGNAGAITGSLAIMDIRAVSQRSEACLPTPSDAIFPLLPGTPGGLKITWEARGLRFRPKHSNGHLGGVSDIHVTCVLCRSGLTGGDGSPRPWNTLACGLSIISWRSAAVNVFSSTTEADATAIAAYRVASISAAILEIVGPGDVSGACEIDLPEQICNMPYLVYLSPDGHDICVSVSGHLYHAPVMLRANNVKMTGFIASAPPGHTVAYDAVSRTVTIS
jgi:hypothetical protein